MHNQGKPKVSVCIPVYNGEQFLSDCITSVLEQDFDDFELLVVDNCSIDETCAIVNSFSDTRIRLEINKTNLGSIANFNKCIELARGYHFFLLPHDDILLPSSLRTFCKFFNDPNVGIAFSSYYTINEVGEQINLNIINENDRIMSSEEALKEFIIHGNPVQGAMVRKEIVSNLKGFDSTMVICCDIDLWSRIALAGYSVAYSNKPQFCSRSNPNQGQQLFYNNNFDKIKEHLVNIDKETFYSQYLPSALIFNYLYTLFSRISKNSKLQSLRIRSLDWPIKLQVKNIIISIGRKNWTAIIFEYKLFKKIMKWGGFFNVLSRYICVSGKIIIRKLFHIRFK